MNPLTNKLETLREIVNEGQSKLLRPDGSEIPNHWAVFHVGELVSLKDYTFKIAYMNDGTIVLEPVKPSEILQNINF